MNLRDYQTGIEQFAAYPHVHSLRYCALGLFGESGEIANQVKKIWRDDDGVLTEDRSIKLQAELGDVLWYAVRFAHHNDLQVGDYTIQIGAELVELDLEPSRDIFEATEVLGIMAATAIAFHKFAEGENADDYIGALLNSIADVANFLDTDIESIAQYNYDKLASRLERGTISGSGDDR